MYKELHKDINRDLAQLLYLYGDLPDTLYTQLQQLLKHYYNKGIKNGRIQR